MDNSYNIQKWINHFCNEQNYNKYINDIDYDINKTKKKPNTRLNTKKNKVINKIQKIKQKDAKLLLYFSKHIQI